jgi:hypothetical protein
MALALIVLAWAAFRGWTGSRQAEPADEAARTAWREFVCGALMITGVFFLGASYAYKLVFALWLVPWLRRRPDAAAERRWHSVTGALLVAVLWVEGLVALGLNVLVPPSASAALAVLKGALVLEQLLDWALIACLLRFLFVYLWWRGGELLPGSRRAATGNELPGAAA